MATFIKTILHKKKFKHCKVILGAGGFAMLSGKEGEDRDSEDYPSAICTLQFWKEVDVNGDGVDKENIVELRLTEEEVVKVEEFFQVFHNAKDHMDNLEYERELKEEEEEEKVERKWEKFKEEIEKVAMVEGEQEAHSAEQGDGEESQEQNQEPKE